MALAARQTSNHIRYEDLTRRRRRAQARSFHYRRTVEIIAVAGRFARRNADADLELRCVAPAHAAASRLLHRDRAGNRICCAREVQHETVAGGLDLAAVVVG